MKNPSRRAFMQNLGACTAGGAALSQLINRRAGAQSRPADLFGGSQGASPWTPPPKLTNPNILVVMVDQMRWPTWLTGSQNNVLKETILPNIFGKLRDRSYVFEQYYTAATVCTAARGTLLTGLYAPQTAKYEGAGDQSGTPPNLNPAFQTWGAALPALNPLYGGNMWWFGKWHLSDCIGSTPLAPYNLNTSTYPGGAAGNPSPDGEPNEGANGGAFDGVTYASDAMITADFVAWLQGEAPTAAPWCATVSLNNPHDITDAPGWMVQPVPPPNLPPKSIYFNPPIFPPAGLPALYSADPNPWNFEDLSVVLDKPSVQYQFWSNNNRSVGPVTNWVQFLNWYFWLQGLVDQQVGLVLSALANSPFLDNTVVIFLADHGEYAGSHGLHDKGYAAYDEVIHVPLYVHMPGQNTSILMNQMCSSVDFFGLLCDFATTGSGTWQKTYPNLSKRQSLWNFLYENSAETRVSPALDNVPYIFHTCDRTSPENPLFHVVCLRTKTDPTNTTQPGAKLGVYSAWADCTVVPDSTPPDMEFYDYNPATHNNTSELGNNYNTQDQDPFVAQYLAALGTWGPPATGLIGSELYKPLVGKGNGGVPLAQAQAKAQEAYYNYVSPGVCS
jgi:arylsulfatase A-like enzyme